MIFYLTSECPRGVVANILDSDIVESEFELQLDYDVHFRTSDLEKGMNPVILPFVR